MNLFLQEFNCKIMYMHAEHFLSNHVPIYCGRTGRVVTGLQGPSGPAILTDFFIVASSAEVNVLYEHVMTMKQLAQPFDSLLLLVCGMYLQCTMADETEPG
jgi:hypothetical protein